jgi:hypothetical protein
LSFHKRLGQIQQISKPSQAHEYHIQSIIAERSLDYTANNVGAILEDACAIKEKGVLGLSFNL